MAVMIGVSESGGPIEIPGADGSSWTIYPNREQDSSGGIPTSITLSTTVNGGPYSIPYLQEFPAEIQEGEVMHGPWLTVEEFLAWKERR